MARMNRVALTTLLGLVACSSSSSPLVQGDILALPADLPALPTFVESDTCQAFLVPGGVSIRTIPVGTSAPMNCKIQVTLANGEVLTSTVSFMLMTSDYILAGASPFQVWNPGARDAAQQDAFQVAGFGEWWYPDCGTPANNCPETCFPAQVVAAPAVCGPYERLMVGCVPGDLGTTGWGCFMRKSTGEIIFSQVAPSNFADFEMCPPQLGNAPLVPSTCPDASAP
jgi:hypothetical protein